MSAGFGTGLDAQLGMAKEVTFGTPVAVSRFFEFNSESIVPTVTEISRMPLGRGRFQRTTQHRTYVKGASGDFEIDAVNKGLGLLLEQMFGAVVVTQVDDTDEYVQVHTPHASGKRGLSATVQVGVPSTDGMVNPFTFSGGKITGWTMNAALDDILKISTSWNFASQTTQTALAVPSYPDDLLAFTFLDGTLSIDGDPVATMKSISLTAEEAMDTERDYFGNVRGEPLANGELVYTGQFDSEFNDMDAYNAWVSGTEIVDLAITFAAGEIPGTGNPYKLEITIPSLKYTGEAPQVSGPEVVQQNLPFKALFNGTDPIISCAYHSDDEAP